MDDKASVLNALEWMKKTNAARLPIVDNAGELQTIVTESGILKFLHAVRVTLEILPPLTRTPEHRQVPSAQPYAAACASC